MGSSQPAAETPTVETTQPWPEPRIRALQVTQVYTLAPSAAAFSYFGALLTLGVLIEVGEVVNGALWFFFATLVMLFRAFVLIGYRRRSSTRDSESWAHLMRISNLLAGIQWGLLGTVFFPLAPVYAQLFAVMVIICFVAGSVTAYAALAGAHEALSIPATLPTVIYLFFRHDGVHWYAGAAGIFFSFAIVHYARRLHRDLKKRFALQIERDDLIALTGALNEKLQGEKLELAHRAAVRGASVQVARDQVRRLVALFEQSPLAQLECDPAGRVLASNAAAQRLFGRSREQLAGAAIGTLIKRRGGADVQLSGLTRAGNIEVEVGAGGAAQPCVATITPLPSDDGRPGGSGIVFTGLAVPVAT
jgi:PAS domain S-box-containing protein